LLKVLYRKNADVKMAESRLFSISTPRSCVPKMVDVKQKMALFSKTNRHVKVNI